MRRVFTRGDNQAKKVQCARCVGITLITLCCIATVTTVPVPPKSRVALLQYIRYWNRLEKFANLVQQYNVSAAFQRTDITVFVPVSSAYAGFLRDALKHGYNTSDPAHMRQLLLYHIAEGVTSTRDMATQRAVMSVLPDTRRLFINSFTYANKTVYTVNGCWIESGDIVTSNGVIHLIDHFLVPIQSHKTVAEFLTSPGLPNLAFQSIKSASIVDVGLSDATNSSRHRFTVFAPNDSYITVMPDHGKDILFNDTNLLKSVFWAHLVEEVLLYIPTVGRIPDTPAKAGILQFYRHNDAVYVSNKHVRARIVQANLPVENGVVHVIDDLLYFVYRSVPETIDTLDNAHFVRSALSKISNQLMITLNDSSRRITFFLPEDVAFAKIPSNRQRVLESNITALTKMLMDHIIIYAERDLGSLIDGETFTTADGKMLTIRRINSDVYIEGGGVRARVTRPDIGCTNGVIHIVNSVLFHRDVTLWDAIQGIPMLGTMKDFINFYCSEMIPTLEATSDGPMTVFLVGDAAIEALPEASNAYLERNPGLIVQSIRGSVIPGMILSSSQIQGRLDVRSLSEKTVTLVNTNSVVHVTGSYVDASVVIEDIWCSNGVLHVVDNIIHMPTRNIIDELDTQTTLSVFSGLLDAFPDLHTQLSDVNGTFTMYVAIDDAFTHMPTHRAKALSKSPEQLRQILNAHIIEGQHLYIDQYDDFNKQTNMNKELTYTFRHGGQVFVSSNNVEGRVIKPNIRCTNGIIHVIDTLLHFPFYTIADVMEHSPDLRPFYEFVNAVDDFYTWSRSPNTSLTMFVPSASFLATLTDFHRTYLNSEPGMPRKLYSSHALPATSLDQRHLHSAFISGRMYMVENRYNVTFTLLRQTDVTRPDHITVDVGYSNLMHSFDVVRNGILCSNGIIYVINGFLNYPLYNTLEQIHRQPDISLGTDFLLKLVPGNSSVDLTSKDTVFTVFASADSSLDYLNHDEISYINENLTYSERLLVTYRHIVKGQMLSYDQIIDGTYGRYAAVKNISVLITTDGVFLRWNNIDAKIIRQNVLTTNGMIHVIDRMLIETPEQTTTPAPTTTRKAVSSANFTNHNSILSFISIICLTVFILTTS